MGTSLHQYDINTTGAQQTEQHVQEMKDLECQFMLVRWLGVASIFVLAWLHNPISTVAMIALGGIAGLYNTVAYILNSRIKKRDAQRALSIVLLTLDAIVVWCVIILFVRDFYTAAYAAFAIVIIEGAMRFGLVGGLVMTVVFDLGLLGAMIYRKAAFDVRFSISGYVFWITLMMIVAIAVGKVTNESRKHRRQSERLVEEKTLRLERERFSAEIHDTVLKTLQGLALEARALQDKVSVASDVKHTAQYIEEVCRRSGKEIRDAVLDLHSESPKSSIGSQISKTLGAWSKDTGVDSKFVLLGVDQLVSLKIGHNLCAILEEALANIHKHASASHVSVSLNLLPNELSLEILDNGHGLNIDTRNTSALVSSGKLGIVTMKERAELLGGQFSVKGDRNGTRISVSVPNR